MSDRANWEVVLRALMKGATLHYQGKVWHWYNGALCFEHQPTMAVPGYGLGGGFAYHVVPIAGAEPTLVDSGMALSTFIIWCGGISTEDLDKLMFADSLLEPWPAMGKLPTTLQEIGIEAVGDEKPALFWPDGVKPTFEPISPLPDVQQGCNRHGVCPMEIERRVKECCHSDDCPDCFGE
jgi:hypothetical protein